MANNWLDHCVFLSSKLNLRQVNLGFSIKEIKIYDRPTTSTSPHHFNALNSPNEDNSFPTHEVLKSFSEDEGTNSTCLTILISAKVFENSVLGMANIASSNGERGLCATKPINNTFTNTAVITVSLNSN